MLLLQAWVICLKRLNTNQRAKKNLLTYSGKYKTSKELAELKLKYRKSTTDFSKRKMKMISMLMISFKQQIK